MRICYVSTSNQWGGGERLLASLVDGVMRAGHEVGLVALEGGALAQWARDRRELELFATQDRGRSPRGVFRLRSWLRQRDYQVLVLNDPHAIGVGGLATLGSSVTKIGVRHTMYPIRSVWKHTRLIDRVVCVSKSVAEQCIAVKIPASQVEVIHGGVSPLRVDEAHTESIRRQFLSELPPSAHNDINLLAVGSLLPVKGLDTAIRGLAAGVELGQPWRLRIAGRGPEEEKLRNLAASLGVEDRVHFLGFREDLGELLAASDIFISASHSEGLSLVLLEAMLAGCPIVTTAVGGAREVLNLHPSGKSDLAELFVPGDAAGLAAAIHNVMADVDLLDDRTTAARKFAEERFSLERMVDGHLDLYERLLGAQAAPWRMAA